MTRRDAIKTAAVGTAAAGALVSPALASAGSSLERLQREDACKCQDRADRSFNRVLNNADSYLGTTDGIGPGILVSPLQFFIFTSIGAGALIGWQAEKLACGTCDRTPSGGKKPAPGGFTPCTPRGGLRRGPQCPGGGGGGGGNNACAEGTSRCTDDLCCFGSDVCCACTSGVPTCCIQEIGCGCCA